MGGHDDVEVVVMDGGSTDHISKVVADFGDLVSVFVSEPDDGQYDAINKGMARTTGDILCWINSGDFFLPGAVANAVSVFSKHREVRWLAGRPCVAEGGALRRQGNFEVVVSNLEIRYGLCCGGATGFLQQEGMFWDRALWTETGGLDTRYRLAADFELWTRFAKATELTRMTIPSAAFSYHDTNRSIVEKKSYMEEVATAISRFSKEEIRIRRRLRPLPFLMRVIRKIPIVKPVSRFILQRSSKLSVLVVSWRKNREGGFTLEANRRVCWIR